MKNSSILKSFFKKKAWNKIHINKINTKYIKTFIERAINVFFKDSFAWRKEILRSSVFHVMENTEKLK